MINEKCETAGQHTHGHLYLKCISWSAIVVGALVGIGLSFLLNLFSVAIGLSIVTTSKEGMMSLAIGGFVGLVISSIVSMFFAGTAAGYLGRSYCAKRNLGVLYGFTTWSLALILTALLTSHIGHYVSNYSDFITNPTVIVVTHDRNMPAMSQSTQNNTSVVTVNAQKATNNLGITSFLIFILFFVGAIASCFGGYFGMACGEAFCKKSCPTTDMKL